MATRRRSSASHPDLAPETVARIRELLGDLDVHSPEFRRQAHEQSLSAAQSPQHADDQAFVDSISWWFHDEED